MKITHLSQKKLESACLVLKSKRTKAVNDPMLGGPKASSVVGSFRKLLTDLDSGILRLDDNSGRPVLMDMEYALGGVGCDIWTVLLIGTKDEGTMLKTWFDAEGTAHIQANYGNYSTAIKFATATDVSDWIVEYLKLQG